MLPAVTKHHDAIQALCRRFCVERLEVFGSAARPDFDPERSDIDFLVRFPAEYDFGPWMTRLQEFKEELAALIRHRLLKSFRARMHRFALPLRQPSFINLGNARPLA